MYLETIIDHSPDLQIIYHFEEDPQATCLQTSWEVLDGFCAGQKPYCILLEHFDPRTNDISQRYVPADLRTWLGSLSTTYKTLLAEQFIKFCRNCQPNGTIQFYH